MALYIGNYMWSMIRRHLQYVMIVLSGSPPLMITLSSVANGIVLLWTGFLYLENLGINHFHQQPLSLACFPIMSSSLKILPPIHKTVFALLNARMAASH